MTRTITRDRFVTNQRIGDYHVERELRREDTGVIYEASHVVLPRRVTIKVMHANPSEMRSLAIQMLREACILEALSHPGVPRVYECGVLPDKRPWVATELVEGTAVDELADPITVVELVALVRDIAAVLDHAHSRGVVHQASVIAEPCPGRHVGTSHL